MTSDLRERVEAALRDFVCSAVAELDEIGDELRPLTAAAAAFVLGGGKRLRPAFCYWGARAVGAPDSDAIVRAAASLELLQACALVHDDVIDRSAIRRGKPSVHEQFGVLHRERDWAGDATGFGVAGAILLGDLFLVWSDAMFAVSGVGEAALARARPIGNAMRAELMAGQYLDVVEQARGGGSVPRALRVARYKAAKYTVERPLHLGAALGGGPPVAFDALSAYGLPLGEAFQLRDDLLGVFGDPEVTGKPAGDDLREGKRTVLIALTVEAATSAECEALQRHLGDPDLDDAAIELVRDIVTTGGAAASVEAMIADLVEAAVAALTGADLEPVATEALISLAGAATRRSD
ncbi:MAG TPA: polyprenyl synthetase family protein [Mycobacteriales bacterium]|nr:polyprenyl synthetase family protein [Mycobacteriales bacterium]